MNNEYVIKKNVDKIRNGEYTDFLNPAMVRDISYRIKKDEYKVYRPYPESDKVILYTNTIPRVRLLEIISYYPLTHREILGSLYGLNIADEVFGDIIIWDNKYFFYVADKIINYMLDNFKMVGNNSIKLREVNLDVMADYKRKYEEIEFIVSSLRLDTVLSRLIGMSRDKIKEKFKNKDIILNYKIVNNNSYMLQEGDIFSIRKYGKYKFIGVIKSTKKDNYIIKCFKYL